MIRLVTDVCVSPPLMLLAPRLTEHCIAAHHDQIRDMWYAKLRPHMALSCNRWLLGLCLPAYWIGYFTNIYIGCLIAYTSNIRKANKLSAKSICQPCFYSMCIKFCALLNLFFTNFFYYALFIIFLMIAGWSLTALRGSLAAQRKRRKLVLLVQ